MSITIPDPEEFVRCMSCQVRQSSVHTLCLVCGGPTIPVEDSGSSEILDEEFDEPDDVDESEYPA